MRLWAGWRLGVAVSVALAGVVSPAAPPTEASTPGTVRLMAVGDVNLGWEVGRRIVRRGGVFPFTKVVGYFDQADLVLANLECVVSRLGTPWPAKAIHLRAPLAGADSLAAAGIDVVSVANNHSLDYGAQAFLDTVRLLDQHKIGHVGGGVDYNAAHTALIVERNGLRIALLGYVLPFYGPPNFSTRAWAAGPDSPGLALGTADVVAADVRATRQQADVVIVTYHGGGEYHRLPNNSARRLADAAIGAGAALVVGHHPHILQGYHRGDHTLIAYSLGNFVFDRFTGRSNDSVILDVTLSANGVESFHWIPIVIERGVPRPAVGAEIPRILGQLTEL